MSATTDEDIIVDGKTIKVLAERDPGKLPWEDLGVDVVIESTGFFTDADQGRGRTSTAGAKKVIISAPAKDEDLTVVMGVNDDDVRPGRSTTSSPTRPAPRTASRPMAKVLHDTFGIERGLMTTIHAYTQDQNLQDGPHKDLRRARAAALNIVPTSHRRRQGDRPGAARAQGQARRLRAAGADPDRLGHRPDRARVGRDTTVDEVNAAFKAAADGPLKGYLTYTEDPIVSSDIVTDPALVHLRRRR